ncbi:Tetratricopeptide TPR_1 repeat-containing protein [Coriobacterium glomerans PW2]|uniref:Tetratricopeptide TPR_1 repeat-containing protein n=1 Tax=Coriobacterium glomerans (strain ATCC 49209 / DSM 20642 / JCM 10262 / PW2) TaxID=700015 RepID=F2N7S3_CORGP|nr:tetratricopeptide repeat protein [Coriobacterium glomerans]AEB06965.1 Tetratricopeptide TPR_1 repeat-containing protein [Coriobacterium glomerans PW2]
MNAQLLDRARAAYRAGDFSAAAQMFASVKDPTEISGGVDHLRGNALMRLGLWRDAAESYDRALADVSYGKRGALLTNRGKALAAAGDFAGAVESFTAATQDSSYATPYKAYLGLGKVLFSNNDIAGAGTAFRSAAIDGTNPAPASALSQLASCFIKLGRPDDAIESYRTALDFIGPRDDPRSINAGLGEAYVAAGRFNDALEAFGQATADGIYQLTFEQQQALGRARETVGPLSDRTSSAGSVSAGVDPLDPLGQSGAMMPDPSNTGFFTLSESELIQQDRQEMKVRRRKRHIGRKIVVTLLFVIIVAAVGLGFGYTRGLGVPSQGSVLTDLFSAVSDGRDVSAFLDPALSDTAKAEIASKVPAGSKPTIESMDQSMTKSTAKVRVVLSKSGVQTYSVDFVRNANHLGWAVSSIKLEFNTSKGDSPSSDSPATQDGANS